MRSASLPTTADIPPSRTPRRLAAVLTTVTTTVALLLTGVGPAAAAETPPTAPAGGIAIWGWNYYGQKNVPADVGGLVAVSGGGFHSVGLRDDGTVVSWGNDRSGQTAVPGDLKPVVAVGAGWIHSLAVQNDGTVITWGGQGSGEIVPPAGLTDVVAVSGGEQFSLALQKSGTVVGWGQDATTSNAVPAGLTGVTAIATGFDHSLALKDDGTVVAWGTGAQVTGMPAGLSGVVGISAGWYHSLAVTSDGTVVAWGSDEYGQTDVPANLTDVVAVSGGARHSLALRKDGSVVGWGSNEDGQLDQPIGVVGARPTALVAGGYHSMALGARPALTADAPPATTEVGAPYSYTFAADSASATFSLASGSLPPGLTLDQAGELSGAVTEPGDSTFTVAARTSFGSTSGAQHTIRVAATAVAPALSGDAPAGTVGTAYDFGYTITGTPAPTATLLSGSLPPGLSLSPSGRVTGTPTAAGTSSFTVQVSSSAGSAQLADSVTITPAAVAPGISGTVAAGMVGSAYDYTYTVTGFPAPAVSLKSGTLPPGLTLEPTGRLSGTPTTAGIFVFTLQATNATGSATATSTLTVSPQKVTARADLRVDLAGPTSAVKGRTAVYTLTTTNAGPSTSSSVFSKVVLPPNTQFVSATGTYTRVGNLVVFQRSKLTNGQSVIEKITVTATATGKGTALATTFSVRTPDPSIRNNADTAATTVR
ncbi:putative Ig domain-containing protein [Rathayibacter sp. VKM Ac-2929]|uniref:putative Ig domain-containing protein n=1 Tax=Rathayibacter sp. VKM Ac-2929 TaxID=2929480 RepID=UPI001FB23DAE|nr:putative Ig domain-containing protein [Rathayibacter sp. VKM Ac-2929]MCJ1674526.1 putative Ig domain-containing protein [Rathayibacter sp. VKM Ac-2929]